VRAFLLWIRAMCVVSGRLNCHPAERVGNRPRTRRRGDNTAVTGRRPRSVRQPVGPAASRSQRGRKTSLVPGGNAAFENGGSFSPTTRKAVAIAASSSRAPRVRLFGSVSEEYHLIRRLDSHIRSPVSPLGENTHNAQFERRRSEARAAEQIHVKLPLECSCRNHPSRPSRT
jgi:hypothetical protein